MGLAKWCERPSQGRGTPGPMWLSACPPVLLPRGTPLSSSLRIAHGASYGIGSMWISTSVRSSMSLRSVPRRPRPRVPNLGRKDLLCVVGQQDGGVALVEAGEGAVHLVRESGVSAQDLHLLFRALAGSRTVTAVMAPCRTTHSISSHGTNARELNRCGPPRSDEMPVGIRRGTEDHKHDGW